MSDVAFDESIGQVALTFSANKMRIKHSLDAITAVHEVVHVRQFSGNWNSPSDAWHDEAEAWTLQYLIERAPLLQSVEKSIRAGDAVSVQTAWNSTWGTSGFPAVIGLDVPKPGSDGMVNRGVAVADLWDVNNAAYLNVRFSASNLATAYNAAIAQKGIIDPSTNAPLVLTAPTGLLGPFN